MAKIKVSQEIKAVREIVVDVPDYGLASTDKNKLATDYVKAALAAGQLLAWKIVDSSVSPAADPAVDDIPF